VTLRLKFTFYLIALHLVFATCAVWFLWDHRVWLIALEVFFALSFTIGVYLMRTYFEPIRLIASGTQFLRDGEFTTRFVPTGQADMDRLVDTYNEMVDRLREERIHNEEQEQLLRKVMARSPGGVITLGVEGNVADANPAALALLGTTHEMLIGKKLAELGTPLARQLAGIPTDGSSLVVIQGRRRVRCQAATFMDRGFPRRFLLLDELTDELHKTEKLAYEKLIRMMSHEVNNTSGAVQSLLQSCLAYGRQLAVADREDFAEALAVAIKRTANLDEFMRGFARVVRLPKPHKQDSNPWDMARQVALLFKDRCATAGISWQEDLAARLPRVSCDQVQMEQVLVNVVKNAIEAIESTGLPGTIRLKGGWQGRRAFLAIADSGPGLSAEAQTNLFTPFFTTRDNGQGIGLTMVQEILLAHGFDFSLENAPEAGAEFTIVF
jgi:two-component system nitrogen regulation sensor histidine kinase NtrY